MLGSWRAQTERVESSREARSRSSPPAWLPDADRRMMRERSVEKRLFALRTAAIVGRNLLFLLHPSRSSSSCTNQGKVLKHEKTLRCPATGRINQRKSQEIWKTKFEQGTGPPSSIVSRRSITRPHVWRGMRSIPLGFQG